MMTHNDYDVPPLGEPDADEADFRLRALDHLWQVVEWGGSGGWTAPELRDLRRICRGQAPLSKAGKEARDRAVADRDRIRSR